MKLKLKSATVETPATIANFGPGFDTFGLCLNQPTDILEVIASDKTGIEIELVEGSHRVPLDPDKNIASVSAREMMRLSEVDPLSVGLTMRMTKRIRPGSGLGSSASAAVGGALAMASLLGVEDKKKILKAAAVGEGSSSGSAHLDNVSPCLYGGFTAVLNPHELEILQMSPPDMKIVVCLPEIVVETASARQMVPKSFDIRTTVSHVGWASGIVHSMMTGNIELMAACMYDDISVPARKKLIKGFDGAFKSAIAAGALSFSISGSGPAVFSLARENHDLIGRAILQGFAESGVKAEYFVASPGKGAKLVSSVQ